MKHPVYRVISFKIIDSYTLKVTFDDNTSQIINFEAILIGKIYGLLKDISLFNQVKIDPEVNTLVWPNGADYDPETLHDWPKYLPHLKIHAIKCCVT